MKYGEDQCKFIKLCKFIYTVYIQISDILNYIFAKRGMIFSRKAVLHLRENTTSKISQKLRSNNFAIFSNASDFFTVSYSSLYLFNFKSQFYLQPCLQYQNKWLKYLNIAVWVPCHPSPPTPQPQACPDPPPPLGRISHAFMSYLFGGGGAGAYLAT